MNRPVTVTNAGSETFYVYDLEGRITVMGNGSAGEYHENRYEYDILGRMTEKTDGEGQSECYEYDNTGKIIKKVDRNGKIWYYEYDGMGRMVSEKGEKDSEGNLYEYDIRSNKIKVRDITGKLEEEYGYNGYGELISEKRGDSETAYEYAPDGELVKLTLYEGGAETFSEYYGYDERARLIYANTPAGSEYYTYDRSDRLISAVNDKAGSEYRYEYGEDGNIAGIYYSVKGVWEGEIQYEYDRAGRRIGEVSINGRRGIKEKKYSYDGAGRLIREKDGGEVTEYTYDAYGNTDGIYRYGEGVELDRRVYTYDKNNRVETAYEGGVYTAYEYDGNGNMISRTRAGERESYEYDGRNRMISARVGMNTAEYEYNSAGIRVAKTVNGERTEYALSGNNVIAEENAQNRNEYYRGKGLIGYSDGKGTYVYRKNGHGDISGVYDMYGILVQEYEYDAYGNEAADYGMYRYGGYAEAVVKESDTNPYRYAGEYYDIETGFMYLRARYYDPSDCRFVSEDPICDGVNWYVYCAGDPVNFIDPNGLRLMFEGNESEFDEIYDTISQITDDKLTIMKLQSTNENSYYYIGTERDFKIDISMSEHKYGTNLLRQIISSDKRCKIEVIDDHNVGSYTRGGEQPRGQDQVNGTDVDLFFNLNPSFLCSSVFVKSDDSCLMKEEKTPNYVILSHEFVHANMIMEGKDYKKVAGVNICQKSEIAPYKNKRWFGFDIEIYDMNELVASGLLYDKRIISSENDIRREHGLPLRGRYTSTRDN